MSWSDIRLKSDDILVDMINDLIVKANSSAAITDQVTDKDLVSPIRLVKSKVELSDRGFFTGYSRLVTQNTSFFMPLEPDGKSVRIMTKFDCGGEKMIDYAYMGNDITTGYQTALPTIMKNTMDDGVTAGEVCSVLDGKQQYYKIPTNTNNSVKQMVATSQPGFTFVFRVYPLLLTNENLSGNAHRATLLYYIENDQVDYAMKIEVGDNGVLHFYVKYLTNYYYSFSSSSQISAIIPPDYGSPDFNVADYITDIASTLIPPIAYIDLAFSFNFSTKAMTMFKNGVSIPVTVGTTPPSSTFPPSFADPPAPTTQPPSYVKPFVNVYNVADSSGAALRINAASTTPQNAAYAVQPGDPTNDPFILTYNINPGIGTPAQPFTFIGGAGSTVNSYIPLCKDTTNSNNCSQAAVQIMSTSTGLGQKLTASGVLVTQAVMTLKGTNGPVGTFYCRIWDNNGNVKFTFGSDDAAVYDNATINVAFQNTSNTTALATGYRFGIEYTTGATADTISLGRNTDQDASIAQAVVHPGASTWSTNTTYDPEIDFYSGQGTTAGNPYTKLANTTGATSGCGEFFGPGCTMEFLIPTTIELYMYRDTTATSGTLTLYHRTGDANYTIKGTLLSIAISSLPTAFPGIPNIVWQNVAYSNSIMANDLITVEVTGATGGFVYVMNNFGATSLANSYNGSNSVLITQNTGTTAWAIPDTTVDLAATMYIGGQSFSGYIELNDTRKRVGIKANTAKSSIVGVIPTKVTATMAKFNNPVAGNVDCYIRNSAGTIMATMGHFSTTNLFITDLSVDFENRLNTYKVATGDTISVEYTGGTATDYIIVKINTGQIDSEDTSLFETLASNLTAANPIANRDFSAVVYTGGVPDASARPMRGIKINANSALIGKPITQVEANIKAVGTFQFGNHVNAKIIRGSDKKIMADLGYREANALISPGFQTIDFTNTTSNYPLAAGDMIGIEANFGDIQNYILLQVSGANVFDGSATCMFDYDNFKYTDMVTSDLTGQLWTGGNFVIPDPITQPKPTPYHYYHGYVLFAGAIPDSGALVDPNTLNPVSNTYLNNVAKEFRMYSSLSTAAQLLNYFNNKWTTSALAFGHIQVQGHYIINLNDNI